MFLETGRTAYLEHHATVKQMDVFKEDCSTGGVDWSEGAHGFSSYDDELVTEPQVLNASKIVGSIFTYGQTFV